MTANGRGRRPARFEVSEGVLRLYGQAVFSGSPNALLARIDELAKDGDRHLVTTLNVNQVLDLQENPAYRSAYQAASLRTIDGMPLVVLARLMGLAKPWRNTGADLIFQVTRAANARGWKVALVGGAPGIAAKAAERLTEISHGAAIRGFGLPVLRSAADQGSADVVGELGAFRPSVVFICLGAPKQELWFRQWRDTLPPGVYVGAGAAVDFAAGVVRRAPKWTQSLGLEWAWRLAQEPRRLARRYLVEGPRFLGVAAASLRQGRRGK
ncbi:MAG: WecB/TagA/CpsF family glycosyltransferase [Bifidobacteriaceae bacterium]|jgi:N-acetylglucosaminyldiphosphoundecaprenol N-acetyl-beta-D-mannosaminyltransferase|nr:WecB/TagA/CpsF family glycosyltransferase [Bifidobacteriaceae bacterium]